MFGQHGAVITQEDCCIVAVPYQQLLYSRISRGGLARKLRQYTFGIDVGNRTVSLLRANYPDTLLAQNMRPLHCDILTSRTSYENVTIDRSYRCRLYLAFAAIHEDSHCASFPW